MTIGSASAKRRMVDDPRSSVDGSAYAPHVFELLAEIHAAEDAFAAAHVLEEALVAAYGEGMADGLEAVTSLPEDVGATSS